MPNVKLTDIPIELQSHILSNVSTTPIFSSKAPATCTVETATWLLDAFPDDLLHAAQSSNLLLKAVINTLGSHKHLLNFHRSKRLSEWIPILKMHVKAVSLTGTTVLGHCEHGCDNLDRIILKTLKALYMNDVALVALNLEDLAKTNSDKADEFAEHAIKTIQRSSSSLKEIAVNVNKSTASILARVTLPNLEVAQISSDDYYGDEQVLMSNGPSPSELFGDILKEINGNAGRVANITAVRELRLYNMHEPPILHSESCSSLFSAVQKLTIMCGNNSKSSEIGIFIANFRNLKNLQWYTGWICSEDMKNIFAGCPDLENLNIYTGQRQILPGDIDLAENTAALKDLFISFRGKQHRLDFSAYLTLEQIKSLGENSPNLRTLAMEIDSGNVGALPLLLGNCRKLRELRLLYSRQAIDCFGREGWPAFAHGICSASDELRVISLVSDRTGPMIEGETEEMVKAIVDILEFMGDRASSVVFRVPINTRNPFIVLDAVWRTLKVAKTHCTSIGNLCLDFMKDYSLGGYQVDAVEENDLLDLFLSVSYLQCQFILSDGQNTVEVGDTYALWEEQSWEAGPDQDVVDGPGELEDWPNDEVEN